MEVWVGTSSDLELENFRAGIEQPLNSALRAAGLPEHAEPSHPGGGAPWRCPVEDLDRLRQIAAHLALGLDLPGPATEVCHNDPITDDYYRFSRTARPASQGAQLSLPLDVDVSHSPAASGLPFTHLMFPDIFEGVYVPIAFEAVFRPTGPLRLLGWIGSSYSLRDDCIQIGHALGLPPGIRLEPIELAREQESKSRKAPLWRRYAREAHACLALLTAARISILSGCAIVFVD